MALEVASVGDEVADLAGVAALEAGVPAMAVAKMIAGMFPAAWGQDLPLLCPRCPAKLAYSNLQLKVARASRADFQVLLADSQDSFRVNFRGSSRDRRERTQMQAPRCQQCNLSD